MFFRIRLDCKFIFGAVAILIAALSLTMSPAARAQNATPDAMPTGTETWLYSFGVGPTPDKCKGKDGANPRGSLTYVPGTGLGLLFGRTSTTTSKGPGFGTIFQIMPNGSSYVVDNYFLGQIVDGSDPENNAMTLVGNVLYGTTVTGGKNNTGAIFSINDNGTGYSSPLVFDFPASGVKNYSAQPFSCFLPVGSVLYGMTSQGGNGGNGAIFTFDTSTSTYARIYSFDGKHGVAPHGQLILDPNGKTFYGMTQSGGSAAVGAVFSFSRTCSAASSKCKNKFKVLHNFTCPNNGFPTCTGGAGANPDHGTLVQSGTTLFGLTANGGKYGNGTLFSIQTNGKHFKILQHFGNPGSNDGISPLGSLLLDGTTLYGTTKSGGNKGKGSVFRINTDGTGYDRIWDFQGGTTDGKKPDDDVILLNSTLYGMTEVGGQCGFGAIFALVPPP
jgi:uncharacterized repeat protein (TIGR03803 family)